MHESITFAMMENFVVSARKYRPSTFDTVVGQTAITGTLKNALKTKHLAQAFLFCGPRGVGKTTCARILAKTINCFNITEDYEACNTCDSCTSFNEGASLNIYELDAASNNSVDDIRNLVDQVRIAPQLGSHKVYIIDEVHMLSNAAFNAFLKTLEEPPAHAVFILATTEKHKIIPTILSRCQIFDFKKISVTDIADHLSNIASKEGIDAEAEALHIIAEKADGALRDALSIFDQLVSFAGKDLTYKTVIDNLNILDYDYYFQSVDFMLEGKIHESLLLLNEILNNGFSGLVYIGGLASHLRNLLVCKDKVTLDLLEVSEQNKERYQAQSEACSLNFLMQAIELCRSCEREYRASQNQRLLVELSLMQMASLSSPTQVQEKKKPEIKAPDTFSKPEKKPKPIVVNEEKKPDAPVSESSKVGQPEAEKEEQKAVPGIKPEIPKQTQQPQLGTHPIRTKTSGLSINALTKSKTTDDEETTQEEFRSELRTDFSEKEFETAWDELITFIEEKELAGGSIISAALRTHKARFDKNFKILLKVDNKSQEEEINFIRTEIHSFLRKRLKNGAIELNLEIVRDKKEKKAYTDEEKFYKLAEEHPVLLKLKKELDLDFF